MKHILILFASLCILCGHSFAAAPKPNVVLILIDDFGYECVTADGGESYRTPVMDKLADAALDTGAKAAKAKLQAALNQFEGPRPEFFVKQGQAFGGVSGEDANGVKRAKGKGKRKQNKAK